MTFVKNELDIMSTKCALFLHC